MFKCRHVCKWLLFAMRVIGVLCICCATSIDLKSCYYGYSRCLGVPDNMMTNVTVLQDNGCVVDGAGNTNAANFSQISRLAGPMVQGLGFTLAGSKAVPFMDGMPCVFGFEEDITALNLQLTDIHITLRNGDVVHPEIATLTPAVEQNEKKTLLLLGNFGYRDGQEPVNVAIRDASYDGPYLAYDGTGPQMVLARLVPKADHVKNERTGTMADAIRPDYGNCDSHYPKSTHVVQLVFSGGVHTKDGIGAPDNSHLGHFTVAIGGSSLSSEVLGLSDLHDHDNYLTICLDLSDGATLASLQQGMTVRVTSERDQADFFTGPKGDCMSPLVHSPCGDSRTKTQTISVNVSAVTSLFTTTTTTAAGVETNASTGRSTLSTGVAVLFIITALANQ